MSHKTNQVVEVLTQQLDELIKERRTLAKGTAILNHWLKSMYPYPTPLPAIHGKHYQVLVCAKCNAVIGIREDTRESGLSHGLCPDHVKAMEAEIHVDQTA